jgi:hypothetical protein
VKERKARQHVRKERKTKGIKSECLKGKKNERNKE